MTFCTILRIKVLVLPKSIANILWIIPFVAKKEVDTVKTCIVNLQYIIVMVKENISVAAEDVASNCF